jgi:hypothetical protein
LILGQPHVLQFPPIDERFHAIGDEAISHLEDSGMNDRYIYHLSLLLLVTALL